LGPVATLAAVERRERRRRAFAVRLVAGGAVGGVDLLAARLQLIQAVGLGRIVGGGEHLLLLLRRPTSNSLPATTTRTHDRHEAVLLAAKLDALAAEGAGLLGLEPQIADEARDRVLLRAEGRHPPGMHDVGPRS